MQKREILVSIHLRKSHTEKTILPLQLPCLASLPFATHCPFGENTSYNWFVFFIVHWLYHYSMSTYKMTVKLFYEVMFLKLNYLPLSWRWLQISADTANPSITKTSKVGVLKSRVTWKDVRVVSRMLPFLTNTGGLGKLLQPSKPDMAYFYFQITQLTWVDVRESQFWVIWT